mmetsp:Transcript_21597/g.38323  ORF Transcript_21597/g.38323 Transcript_21597/m.38323 type:complete len:221 (-) Transcript_21597:339-1001(-)
MFFLRESFGSNSKLKTGGEAGVIANKGIRRNSPKNVVPTPEFKVLNISSKFDLSGFNSKAFESDTESPIAFTPIQKKPKKRNTLITKTSGNMIDIESKEESKCSDGFDTHLDNYNHDHSPPPNLKLLKIAPLKPPRSPKSPQRQLCRDLDVSRDSLDRSLQKFQAIVAIRSPRASSRRSPLTSPTMASIKAAVDRSNHQLRSQDVLCISTESSYSDHVYY